MTSRRREPADLRALAGEPAGPARILFAEHDADLLRYVRHLLDALHHVQVVADGDAALTAARRDPPDIVLADVALPVLDGLGLLRALRADALTRSVPIILLSAPAGRKRALDGLEAGASDYLAQPFTARELLARVHAALSTARGNREALDREQALRRAAEESEIRSRGDLAAELEEMQRLHALGARLLSSAGLQRLLEEVLDAAIELLGADFGHIQLVDESSGVPEVVVRRGFTQELSGRSVQSAPLFGGDGRLLGMLATHFRELHRPSDRELRFLDLYASQAAQFIERERNEEARRLSEERFRLLLESIPHHLWSVRSDPPSGMTTVGYWNQQLLDYTGLTAEQLRRGGREALHPDDVERVRAAWRTAVAEGSRYEMEQRLRGRDGRYRRFVCRGVPMRDPQGRTVEWLGTGTDVEDRRQAEEALQRSRAELAHVARVTTLGQMAVSIAHEVNQPLAAVVANGHAGLRWLDASPPILNEARHAIARIVRDGNRAADVIERIRRFLKRGDGEPVAVDIVRLVADVLTIVEAELAARNVSHRFTAADGDLPLVVADPVQVRQVVLNLVVNAIDAMLVIEDAQRTLDVSVEREGTEALRVAVRDNGVGLPAGDRVRAFEAFHTTKPDGLGMGLAISRSIVEAHGGRLWVTANEPGPGETFQFTLPVAVP